jgi:hypothetical protein
LLGFQELVIPNRLFAYLVRFQITMSIDGRTVPEAGADGNLYFIPQLYEFDDDDKAVVGEPIYQGPRQALLRSDADNGVLFRVPIDIYHTDPLQRATYEPLSWWSPAAREVHLMTDCRVHWPCAHRGEAPHSAPHQAD